MNAARKLLVILAILATAQGCTLCNGWCPLGCQTPTCPWDTCPATAPMYSTLPPTADAPGPPTAGMQ